MMANYHTTVPQTQSGVPSTSVNTTEDLRRRGDSTIEWHNNQANPQLIIQLLLT